ncbi:MAG: carboxypeptidase-like regulatory domain-containing protein, partial [Acidobacteriota bacterium]|nr:carboxypeptidase-like regulatory domain-containing protein [Acidobacteriota bacterium]
ILADQRGFTRPLDLPDNTYPNASGGDATDIGSFELDAIAPTVTTIDDGDANDTVTTGTTLTYIITFSEDIDASTVSAADFDNAGSSAITIDTITETSAGVFSVQVTPTSAGTLIMRIPSGATISDPTGNNLAAPVTDDTTVTVNSPPPTAATVSIGGRVLSASGRGIAKAVVTLADINGNLRFVVTNSFGYYRFEEVAAGAAYILQVRHKHFEFAPQVLTVTEEMSNLDFTASP